MHAVVVIKAPSGQQIRALVEGLRESLELADTRKRIEFLAALSAVGDASCLDAIAAARARTSERW